MKVPDDLAALLAGTPTLEAVEQAFPFVTVDDAGFAHPVLLSRAELSLVADEFVVAVVSGPTTIHNLVTRGVATLLAIGGTVAHSAKLRVLTSATADRFHGVLCEVVAHRRDSLGIPLTPIGFVAIEAIAREEQWSVTASLAATLAARADGLAHDVPSDGTAD